MAALADLLALVEHRPRNAVERARERGVGEGADGIIERMIR
jgi:hypothetical protein